MDDGLDAFERRPDRIQVGDVGDVARERLLRQGQGRQLVPPCQVLTDRGADHPRRR